jgi:hypothetical protein
MLMLQWVGEHLLPIFNPPWTKVTLTTYNDFATLPLSNQ